MGLQVILDVFSGRPNPSWEVDEDELRSRLKQSSAGREPSQAFPGLGYRGLVIRETARPAALAARSAALAETRVFGGAIQVVPEQRVLVDQDRTLERWLLSSMPSDLRQELGPVEQHLTKALAMPGIPPLHAGSAPLGCPPCNGALAPSYNPGPWNAPPVQPYNNCYNYANDNPTNTFAQPGRASGEQYVTLSCPDVSAAAVRDGLVVAPGVGAQVPDGFYVALVMWPGSDYHWYRQDVIGCWSHKPGSTPARDVDNRGTKITDPAACDRGPYTQVCGYQVTRPGHVTIR